MKPLIAINTELEGSLDAPKLVLPIRYTEALEAAGARPVLVPPVRGEDTLEQLLSDFDGVLLSGSDDFDTERLGLGPTHPAAKPVPHAKQDFDARLVQAALAAGMPLLGVCYGMQLMGLATGGTMYQHLPEDRPGAREHRGGMIHSVRIRPGSKLAEAAGVEEASVVSRHHQALSGVGSDWDVSATDDEGLIEAIEHRSLPFAVGVQWHPELSSERSDRGILESFVQASRRFADGAALQR